MLYSCKECFTVLNGSRKVIEHFQETKHNGFHSYDTAIEFIVCVENGKPTLVPKDKVKTFITRDTVEEQARKIDKQEKEIAYLENVVYNLKKVLDERG